MSYNYIFTKEQEELRMGAERILPCQQPVSQGDPGNMQDPVSVPQLLRRLLI